MKILKQLFFAAAVIFCFTFAAAAQRPDKTPVPKGTPPVIIVPPKKPDEKPKQDEPKNDERKKPEIALLDFQRRNGI
ncbi:hypothetical protein BH10ACI1_BH10ACI1_27340 [soil metagenome]